jgi:hypothetical protein
MVTFVVYAGVKGHLIDHFSIHVYATEVFDSFMMTGKVSSEYEYIQMTDDTLFSFP